LILLKRDCDMLANKGLRFTLIESSKAEQLGETLDLCKVTFNVLERSVKYSGINRLSHGHGKETRDEVVLQEKLTTV
jgi:hypothetical protein